MRRVLADDGKATSWEVATAIAKLAKTKPDIINLSLVCYTEDGEPPLVLATAIDRVSPETVIVAAAGNHGNPEELEVTEEEFDLLIEDLDPTDRAERPGQRKPQEARPGKGEPQARLAGRLRPSGRGRVRARSGRAVDVHAFDGRVDRRPCRG